MEIFDPIIDVFNFILSILDTIIQGITGITSLIFNIFDLFNNIIKVLPTPLYVVSVSFIGVFSTIFIYKLVRKG